MGLGHSPGGGSMCMVSQITSILDVRPDPISGEYCKSAVFAKSRGRCVRGVGVESVDSGRLSCLIHGSLKRGKYAVGEMAIGKKLKRSQVAL
jgi:hypothetical protein